MHTDTINEPLRGGAGSEHAEERKRGKWGSGGEQKEQ